MIGTNEGGSTDMAVEIISGIGAMRLASSMESSADLTSPMPAITASPTGAKLSASSCCASA